MNFKEFYMLEYITDNPNFMKWFEGSEVTDEYGNPLKLYHETRAENVPSISKHGFDISKVGGRSGDIHLPNGIFMKPTGEEIGVGGGAKSSAQMPLYASIKNPLYVKNRYAMEKYLSKSPEYEKIVSEYKVYDREMKQKFDDMMNSARSREEMRKLRALTRPLLDEWGKHLDELGAKARKIATEVIKRDGYDGVIMDDDRGSFGRTVQTYIAFYPNQVKSAIGNKGTFNPNSNNINEDVDNDKIDNILRSLKSISDVVLYDWGKTAFGFSVGDMIELDIEDINIKFDADLQNAIYKIDNGYKFGKHFKDKFEDLPPVEVVYENGEFYLDDGHHRYYYAKKNDVPKIKAKVVKIVDNPILALGYDSIDELVHRFNKIQRMK